MLRGLAVAVVVAVTVSTAPGPAVAAPAGDQWHTRSMKLAQAHRLSTGAGVVVAVIDTGVGDHPDLRGRVLPGMNFLGRPAEWNFDHAAHGTGVAGLIAARGGAGRTLGVAPNARILPVKVLASVDEPGPSRIGEAIRWATDHGAKVINLSVTARLPVTSVLGRDNTLASMYEDVRYAVDRDVVVVTSAGNGVGPAPDSGLAEGPAVIPGVLAVGATDRAGNLWPESRHGRHVGITAPGVEISVIMPRHDGRLEGYAVVPGGTSAAAPLVAGAAALIRARYPTMKAADVLQRLVATADDAGPPGRDEQYGFGRLDLMAALTAEVPPVTENPLGAPTDPPRAASLDEAGDDGGSSDSSLRVLAIGGIAALACLLIAAVAGIVLFLALRRRRRAA